MGFLTTWFLFRFSPSRWNCKTVFLRPSRTVKQYFLSPSPGQNCGQIRARRQRIKNPAVKNTAKTPKNRKKSRLNLYVSYHHDPINKQSYQKIDFGHPGAKNQEKLKK